jgi:hypothetical protein
VQGGETHAYAISVELRAVLRAVLQPPARIGWTISVPAISNPSDPAVWPLWRIAIGRAKLLNVSAPGTLLGFSSTVWRISRRRKGRSIMSRCPMPTSRLSPHARAVGLFDTSLNHRARCCKSSGIGVPVFLPSIRAHCTVMSAIVYRSPAMNGRIANSQLSQRICACACMRPWCAMSATCVRRSL